MAPAPRTSFPKLRRSRAIRSLLLVVGRGCRLADEADAAGQRLDMAGGTQGRRVGVGGRQQAHAAGRGLDVGLEQIADEGGCHHHAFELSPSLAEARHLVSLVRQLADEFSAGRATESSVGRPTLGGMQARPGLAENGRTVRAELESG